MEVLNQEELQEIKHLDFAKLGRIIVERMNKYQTRRLNIYFKKYNKETLAEWLVYPEQHYRELRDASRFLYELSPQYCRLINYFARMHMFSYVIAPFQMDQNKIVDKRCFFTCYNRISKYLEKMNLRHEMQKIAIHVFLDDVFYGYIYQTEDSFYIRQMPSDYCKIVAIEDGCFLYGFDFSYFTQYPEKLEDYGSEFIEKYEIYKADANQRWQLLNAKREFCIKFNEEIPYPSVPFMGVFEGIFDITDYKMLDKAKAETDNYKVIALQIPIDDEGHYKIDYDDAVDFYNRLLEVLPDNIGAFLTPMAAKDYDFEKAGQYDDGNVSKSIKNFWNDAGVSSVVFGGDKVTAATLEVSTKADADIVYALGKQIERNVNRLLKYIQGKYKFKIMLLDVTHYNQAEMFSEYLRAAQASLPTTTMAMASLGLTQTDMYSLNYIENDILDIPHNYIPLSTSYTKSGDYSESEEGGAPTQEEKGETLSDDGEKSRETGANTDYGVML